MLGFVQELGGDYEKIRLNYPSEDFVKVYTFNSARKMMGTVIRTLPSGEKDSQSLIRVHVKGASEVVLKKCISYLGSGGNVKQLNEFQIESLIKSVVEPMANEGLRTLCIAYRNLGDTSSAATIDLNDESGVISELTCLALVGIEDPVRPEVPDAIRRCQEAGVVVRMITGDNIGTARSIALKCGIIRPDDDFLVLESKQFNEMIKDPQNGSVRQDKLDEVYINFTISPF